MGFALISLKGPVLTAVLGNTGKGRALTCAWALPVSNLTVCPDGNKSIAEIPNT